MAFSLPAPKSKSRQLKTFSPVALSPGRPAWDPSIAKEPYVPGELIVKFKSAPPTQYLHNFILQHGNMKMDRIFKHITKSTTKAFSKILQKTVSVPDLFPIYKLKYPPGTDLDSLLKIIKNDPQVAYAQPNYYFQLCNTPDDTDFSRQWDLNNTGQTGGTVDADMDAPEAWEISTGSSTVVVAVVDTGVDYDHPDLAGNIWTNTAEIPDNGLDDDGDGFIDDIRGWDFSDNDNDPMDYHGHGSHVSGTIGAVTNNNTGVAGVNWNVKIMPVKIFPNATNEVGAAGITYAADNGAKVISNSWGGGEQSDLIEDAIDYALAQGAVVVFAAGNSSTSNPDEGYPASYAGNIAVAATDHNDQLAYFSNYGDWVDVCAPGVDIYSTFYNDTYATLSGTSMACPHVAGLAALLFANNPTWTNEQVRSALENSCDDITEKNSGYAGLLGTGRINAYNALTYVIDTTPPAGVPSTPTDEGNIATSTDIVFNWAPGTAADPESGIKGYQLQVSTTPGGNDKFNTFVGNVLTRTITNCTDQQTYYARIRAKNGSGLYTDWSASSDGIRIILPPLGEVLDNDTLTFTRSGDANWYGQSTAYFYGGTAAHSGFIADSQNSTVETIISGSGEIRFAWKVSSEEYYDFLTFYVDGIKKAEISGEVDWEQKTFAFTAGTHTCKWVYSKDSMVNDGTDAGWLDKVELLPPDSMAPVAVTDLSISTTTAYSATLTFTASGDDGTTGQADHYEIRYAQEQLTENSWANDSVADIQVTPAIAGEKETITIYGLEPLTTYYFGLKVSDGSNLSLLSNIPSGITANGVGLAEALDNSALIWSSGGNNGWFGESTIYYADQAAAQSGPIDHNGHTSLQTTLIGPATISFYWKVSSEQSFDFLTFYVDNESQFQISGEVNWEQKTITIAEGKHTLKWSYQKDFMISGGEDAGWVDKITFVDTTPPAPVTTVNDGLEADLSVTMGPLSANWTDSQDNESGIAKYWYAFGTTPGGTELLDWTSNALRLSVTKTDLSLIHNTTYYTSIKTENGAGLLSAVTTSNGQLFLDTSAPAASLTVTPDAPLKTGRFLISLSIIESGTITNQPLLSFTPHNGIPVEIPLAGSGKFWTGASYIESYMEDGAAVFSFSAKDTADNTGNSIISGSEFTINNTVYVSSGGYVSNSDGTTIHVPAHACEENIHVRITVPDKNSSRIKVILPSINDDLGMKEISGVNLLRDISATGDVSGKSISAFSTPLTLTIPYPDTNNDGLIDGTNLDERSLGIFHYNETQDKWILEPGYTINTSSNTVEATVAHLSLYMLAGYTSYFSMPEVKAYPNPCYPEKDGYLRIGGIPIDAEDIKIYIYSIAGELVRILEESDEIQTLTMTKLGRWDGRNENGEKVASGIYICLVKTKDTKGKIEKVAIFW